MRTVDRIVARHELVKQINRALIVVPADDIWLTLEEAATFAVCSKTTIRRRVSEGRFVGRRPNDKTVVQYASLAAWFHGTEQEAAAACRGKRRGR